MLRLKSHFSIISLGKLIIYKSIIENWNSVHTKIKSFKIQNLVIQMLTTHTTRDLWTHRWETRKTFPKSQNRKEPPRLKEKESPPDPDPDPDQNQPRKRKTITTTNGKAETILNTKPKRTRQYNWLNTLTHPWAAQASNYSIDRWRLHKDTKRSQARCKS